MKHTLIGLLAGIVVCGLVTTVQSQSTSSSSQSGSGQVSGQASGSASSSGFATAGGFANGSANGFSSGSGSGFAQGVVKPTHVIEWETQPGSGDTDVDVEALKRAQHDYLRRAADTGKVIWSGPYVDDQNQPEGGGLTLVRFNTTKEAEQFASEMPLTKAGVLNADVHKWSIEVEALSAAQRAAAAGSRGGG